MAFYFALFNVSAINLEEQEKRKHYRELKKSNRYDSADRRKQRCQSEERQRATPRRSPANVKTKPNQPKLSNIFTEIHDDTLSMITMTNTSLDSIPIAISDYRKITQVVQSPNTATPRRRIRKKDSPSVRRMPPLLANGDIIRNPLWTSTPDRPISQGTLARRDSTPSYKRVTFRHEQQDKDFAPVPSPQHERTKNRSIFSKPMDFLGRLSSDDRHHQNPANCKNVHDRPTQANARSHNSRQQPSALGKLRAVITKLMVENRRQRILAFHWQQNHNETNDNVQKFAQTSPTSVADQSVSSTAPLIAPTPTPTESISTTLAQQTKISYQNMASTAPELQPKGTQLEKASVLDNTANHYDQYSSIQIQRSQRTMSQRFPPLEQKQSSHKERTQSDQHDQYRQQWLGPNGGNPGGPEFARPIGNVEKIETMPNRSASNVGHQYAPQPQSSPSRLDLRKRWIAIVGSTIPRTSGRVGSYHPRLADEQTSSWLLRNHPTFATSHNDNLEPQRQANEESQDPKDLRNPRNRRWSLAINENPTKINSSDDLLSYAQKHHRNETDPKRRQAANQTKNGKKRELVRRRSSTDKNGNSGKRNVFETSWKRWFPKNNAKSSIQKHQRLSQLNDNPMTSSPKDEAVEFQELLRRVRYDENSNISYDEDELESTNSTQFNLKKQIASIKGKDAKVSPVGCTSKRRRRRFPIGCYINPLYTSQSAPNSPAKNLKWS